MEINWVRDADAALAAAKREQRPVFLDFSAAPMWSGCARLEAEVYPNERVARFIGDNFIPVKIHIKEQPQTFQRFGAQWTPTGIILDPDGKEQHRLEGFLPVDDFLAQLALGLAKSAFAHQNFPEAEKRFRAIVEEFPNTDAAPEALYWAGVSKYKATNEPAPLAETAREFQRRYTNSTWAKKASVWA